MKCGSCKGDHETVAEVRACYGVVEIDGQKQEVWTAAGNARELEPLSESQYNFMNKLRIERGEAPDLRGYEEASNNQTKEWAKLEIARLKGLPKTKSANKLDAVIATITEGRYAVDSLSGNNDLDFYMVDKPTSGRWAGYTFVSMIVGGHDRIPVKSARRHDVLRVIAETGPEVAAMIYSNETRRCNKCDIELTKYASRQLGKGRTCAGKCGQGAEWDAIQRKWEADERAGLHAISDDPFEATLDHDEYARFERVSNRAPDHKYDLEPKDAVTDYLADNDPESATWK